MTQSFIAFYNNIAKEFGSFNEAHKWLVGKSSSRVQLAALRRKGKAYITQNGQRVVF